MAGPGHRSRPGTLFVQAQLMGYNLKKDIPGDANMRWFVFSDLHGSAHYCEKTLEAFEREKADRMLFLGDILNHGPRNALPERYDPPAVIDMLNRYRDRIIAIKGNCDSDVDEMVMEFPISAQFAVIEVGGKVIYVTHGHVFNEKNLPPMCIGDILMHGHTHVPACVDHGDYLYVNPGSVSIPKGDSWNSYMILDDEGMRWKDLDGNVRMEYFFNK